MDIMLGAGFEEKRNDVFFSLAARHKVEGYIFICDPSVRTSGLAVMLRPLLREFSFVERHMFGDLFLREGKASRRDQGGRGAGERLND